MITHVSHAPLGWFYLVRPRFVYLWVRVGSFPLPIFLFAPLVLLEVFLWALGWLWRDNPDNATTLKALGGLRGRTWVLRKMPPFVLLELEMSPKAAASGPLHLRFGLW
ncbi:hypothetical protein [Meiothermus rufus]|uniref:hypothetical protein n=1 Tax=Meiothermus rufus TaxID=604332 RepID=UPI0004120B84|nr:hypothetical protein [Meiothermus rufus]